MNNTPDLQDLAKVIEAEAAMVVAQGQLLESRATALLTRVKAAREAVAVKAARDELAQINADRKINSRKRYAIRLRQKHAGNRLRALRLLYLPEISSSGRVRAQAAYNWFLKQASVACHERLIGVRAFSVRAVGLLIKDAQLRTAQCQKQSDLLIAEGGKTKEG